ncbi:AAA family ATPase [Mumia sp. DW29H23]|uniref:AAA family ATPase n=1 Tax=Mumia sp. DW29H23 TaxID=3421241 RepID=UPI003D68813A
MDQPDGRLYGRDTAVATWELAAARVSSGHGACLACTGPAGVGKSRVLALGPETLAPVRHLRAVGDRLNQDLPGSALWQLLGRDAQQVGSGMAPFDGPGARLQAALRGGPPESDVLALRYAAAWVLRSLAAAGPVLVSVDDAQWCDRLSAEVLCGLPTLLADDPVVVALGVRTEPGSDAGPFSALLDGGGVLRADLRPLTRPEVGTWLRAEGLPAGRETVDLVAAASGGLPYYVAECVRELRTGGGVGPGDPNGPDGAARLVAERVRGLDDVTRGVLVAVVCLADRNEEEQLLAVTGLTPSRLEDAYATLRAAHLITPALPAAAAHPIVVDVVESVVGADALGDVHERIATAFAAAGFPVAVHGPHLLRTRPGADPRVAATLADAADEAVAAGAGDLARRMYERALQEDGLPGALRSRLRDAAGGACVLVGDLDGAVEHWSADLSGDASVRARRWVDLGNAHFQAGRGQAAEDAFGRALALLDDATARSEVLARIVGIGFQRGEPGRARDAQLAAVVAQDPADDTPADALLLCQEAYRLAISGEDAERAGDLGERGVAPVGEIDYEEGAGAGYVMGLAAMVEAERDDASLRLLDRSIARALERGAVLSRANNLYHRGYLHFERGRLRRARTDLESCVAAGAYGWRAFTHPATSVLGRIYVTMGDVDLAEKLVATLEDDPAAPPLLLATDAYLRGVVDAANARHDDALTSLTEAMELSEGFRTPGFQAWHRAAVVSATAVGKTDLALQIAEEIVADARRFGAPRGLGATLSAASVPQPFEEAVRMLREAVGLLSRTEAKLHHAEALGRLAALLAGSADPEDTSDPRQAEAVSLAARARGIADRIGAARLSEQLSGLAPPVVDAGASESRVDRLSPAELSVCELAASGLTNRQIAEQLFLSIKTVEWHLSASYAKLGIRSRKGLGEHLGGPAAGE